MSEEALEPTTTDDAEAEAAEAAEAEIDDLFERAVGAAADDEDASEAPKAAETDAKAPAPAKSQEGATEGEESAKDDDAEEPPDPDFAETPPWRAAQAKKYKDHAARMLEEAREREQRAEQRLQEAMQAQQQLADLQQLSGLLKQNPAAAITKMAQQAGVSPTQLYEQLTQQQLSMDGNGQQTLVMQELQALKEELRGQREANAKAQQEAQQRYQQEQRQLAIQRDVNDMVAVAEHPELSQEFRHFAALPKEERGQLVREAIDDALQVGATPTLREVVSHLDRQAARRIDVWKASIARFEGVDPAGERPGENAQGHRPPAQRAKAGNRQPAALTNGAAAATSGARRDKTREELEREADAFLDEALSPLLRPQR